jgi:MFS family permease
VVADEPSSSTARGLSGPALVFFTSAAVLVLEILAGRLVAPYVGVSLETYTGIIGTVLAGIALGSAVGGRLADRRDPRRLLGPLLIAGGLSSLLVLPVIGALGPGVAGDGGGPVGIVLLAVSAFVIPTTLLSAVTPMVAKLRLSTTAETGTVVGGLSAAGTAGALVGTFATGFVFVAALPTRTIVVAVGVALTVTGMALTVWLARRMPAAGAVGLVVALMLAAASPSPCQLETRYYCAAVLDEGGDQVLVLDNLRHSYIDLDDRTNLGFRYTRLFAQVVGMNFDGGPLDALHVGGGGFTFPAWLRSVRPDSTSTVLEIDPELVELAERRRWLDQRADLQVKVGDARLAIAEEPTDGFDLVVGDAFGALSVPWHLATREMIEQVRRVLRDDGIYVLNVIDAGPRRLVRAELKTLASVFSSVGVIAPPDGAAGNYVLVAADRPIVLHAVDERDGNVIADVETFIGDVPLLRDDYAPVDQLITRR